MRAAAASGGGDPEVRAALDAVRGLRPGEWSPPDPGERVDVGRLADIVDRVAAGRGSATSSTGAVAGWRRELADLLNASADRVPAARWNGQATDPADRLLVAGEDEARTFVERVGGSWDAGNYRNLYRAARLATGRERPWAAPDLVSGVASTAYAAFPGPDVDVDALPHARGRLRGRADLIGELIREVRAPEPSTTVLVGFGGIGKTSVAIEVARRVREKGCAAFWIAASDASAMVTGLEQAALRLGVPLAALDGAHRTASDTRAYLLALWALLDGCAEPWLILVDDVGAADAGDVAWAHRPTGSGNVLVTSRFGEAATWPSARCHELGEVDRHAAAQLLQDRFARVVDSTTAGAGGLVEHGETAAARLSLILPGLPLALATVGDLLARSGPRDVDDRVRRVMSMPWSDAVGAVYDLCLDALGPHRAAGRRLLRLLACFAPDEALPESIFTGIGERRWSDDVDGIVELVRVGLVERSVRHGSRPCLRVHPAMAEHCRRDFVADAAAVVALDVRAVDLLEEARKATDWGRPADWPAVVAMEPHVRELVESPVFVDVGVPAEVGARVLWLADRASAALMRSGRHEDATALLDRALVRFAWLGDEAPDLLASRHTRYWMVALDRGGDLPRARLGLEELRVVCDRVLGREHPTTVKVLDTLGWVLAEQGELPAARALLEEVIRVRDARGDSTRYACASRHRLAWVRVMMGEGTTGVAAFERVLEERRTLLGPDHLDVLSTRYRLAWALSSIGEHDRARGEFALLLEHCEEALGTDHPLTLMVRSRVAWAAMLAGDLTGAHDLYRRLIPEQEKVLGSDHRRVLVNAHRLAVVALRLGDPARAEEDLRSVVARREELLGPDHALSLDSREMHAWALFRSGRAEEADREFVALVADRRRVLGEDDEATFDARHRTARVVLHRGRIADARTRLGALVADEHRVLGVHDPRALRSRHALALATGLHGDHRAARHEFLSVLAAQSMVLGPEHEETLATRDRLAWLQGLAGADEDLVDAVLALLQDRVRVLGPEHPHTMTSRYRLAWALHRAGRVDAAARTYDDLVEDVAAARGPSHPHALRARAGRLRLRRAAGRTRGLVAEASELVDALTRHLGASAMATLRAEAELAQVEAALGWHAQAARRLRGVRARQNRVIGSNHPDVHRLERVASAMPRGPVDLPPCTVQWR